MRKMELKVLVKVGLVLFFIGFTATTVDGRFVTSSFITQLLTEGDFDVKSTTTACCDKCDCDMSTLPPRCQCQDVGTSCHSACKSCMCTRSIPPQCRCGDVVLFCYDQCTPSQAISDNEQWESFCNLLRCEAKPLRLCFHSVCME